MIKRKLLLVERIMYIDATTPLNCVFTAKIKGEISKEQIEIALAKIQKKHPLLRAAIDFQDKQHPVFVVKENMKPIPLRIVKRQTDTHWLEESEQEWYRPFKEEDSPLAQLVWIKGAELSELLWVSPHCICDGTSMVSLMQELLALIDDPTLDLEPYPLFQSVNHFLSPQFDLQKKERKAKLFLLLGKCFFLLQRKNKKRNLGKNYAIHWKLDPADSAVVTQKCKNNGISVHAILCTAFMQAFQDVQGKSAKEKVISPIDIRHFIPEIKKDHMFAFAPTIELSLKKKTPQALDQAKQIKKELTQKIEKMDARELLWMGEQMHPLAHRMIALLKSSRGGHDLTLSNMGNLQIQNAYKNFTLEDIFSPTVAFPWLNSNTLVTTSYRNQMDFTLMSNQDFLPKQEALKIKDKAIELLTLSL
ncbi:condensation domain-containing protein [Flavobacterium collinsii]|uniref:Condensation domain-containing protein n=1 Tax=Flavobacterium collinsii TaxID=1114861 RepID=A0A9W4TL16_9FLAO|nr:condensation domain-containing protein [Flavobacterium collinsii]CAI2768778.1 Condensation domain-containing protein [Flavobacterium collinsii]